MRIHELLHEPRRGAAHGNPELFGELAIERGAWRFAGLELAAREFPIAGVRFSGGTLREQHPAIRLQDDRRRNVQQTFALLHAPRLVLRSPAAPA
jgi:hypothetical protein